MSTVVITITGQDAAEIKRDVRAYVRPQERRGWHEVRIMRECDHGCKLHVRRRGCVDEYALIHYAGYGCKLGRDTATMFVRVRVA